MKYFKYILALVFVLVIIFIAVGFSIMNSEPVSLSLLPSFQIEWSLAAIVLSAFVAGLLIGLLLVSVSLFGQKVKTGKAKRDLKKVEKEVENLRMASNGGAG